VRIVEWTDVLCDHCAELHETLETLRQHTPAGSYSVESRQFPLDGNCNPLLQPRPDGDPVRCLGARARVCMEGHERYDEFSTSLFAAQSELDADRVRSIAAGFLPAEALDACLNSPATQARLDEDARLASGYDPDGTPIVAINGRQGTSFPPFLYAMILAGGNAEHPAFASLPPANPSAHLH
jgi:serine/threonine-protein kinase